MRTEKWSERDTRLKKELSKARTIWLWNIKNAIIENGALEFRDENEENLAPYIHTMDSGYGYVYRVSFDKVKTEELYNGTELCFHCKDGDGLWNEGQWVNERDFADLSWEELLDYIVWPD